MVAINPAVQKDMELLKDWYSKQLHLPQDLDDKILIRFLHSCFYKIEDTKKTIDLFFGIRASSPELVYDRDPLSSHMKTIMSTVNFACIKISGNRNLWIWQLNDLETYDYMLDARFFFMFIDAWMLHDNILEESDISIIDTKNVTLKFITKYNISVSKKLLAYQESAIPLRLKEIHVINSPPFIDTLFNLFKPLMKQEMRDKIHFHSPKTTSIFDFVGKDDLPKDMGGTHGTLETHSKAVIEMIMGKRDILTDNNFWKSSKKNKDEYEIDAGSFKVLDID